jgi:hypothetical protein
MPKTNTVEEIIRNAVAQAVQRIAPSIQRRISELAAAEVDAQLKLRRKSGGAMKFGRGRVRPQDLTRWVADRRARRVPKFVIEMTGGIDTKRKVVARYGENAVFEKGKPLPKAK